MLYNVVQVVLNKKILNRTACGLRPHVVISVMAVW